MTDNMPTEIKTGRSMGEMLARVRDIRDSERRMYLRVKEIFAMTGDYDPSWSETTKFFSIIQNKLHFAATGLTASVKFFD